MSNYIIYINWNACVLFRESISLQYAHLLTNIDNSQSSCHNQSHLESAKPEVRRVQLISPDGSIYEGNVVKGRNVGFFRSSKGNRYVGSFSENQITGFGTKYFASGEILTGQWLNGLLVLDINEIESSQVNPAITRASKMNLPNLGADVEYISIDTCYCGPTTTVGNCYV